VPSSDLVLYSASQFCKIPVADLLHSAFYPCPMGTIFALFQSAGKVYCAYTIVIKKINKIKAVSVSKLVCCKTKSTFAVINCKTAALV